MRVLQLADLYPPAVGGIEQHVQLLAHELAARGHRVTVATVGPVATPAGTEDDDGVPVHRVSSTLGRLPGAHEEGSRPFAAPAPDPELVLGLARVLKRERPDVVHAHGWIVGSYLPLAAATGARLVVTAHDYALVCPRKDLRLHGLTRCSGPSPAKCLGCAGAHYGPLRGWPLTAAEGALGPLVRRMADRFIAVSRAVHERNRLEGLPADVIPNFLPERDANPLDAVVARHLRDLPDGPFLLFVGALGGHKGFPVLLDAYARLSSPPPLVSIGHRWVDTPSDLPAGVRVLEDWPNAAVRAAWRRALIGVVPSVWDEPFGIVALEAMDAGVPLVASAVGGLADIVADGETGILTPPDDPAALAGALQRLLDDDSLRRALGAQATRRIARYRPEVVVPQIEAVYRRALDRDRRAHRPPAPPARARDAA